MNKRYSIEEEAKVISEHYNFKDKDSLKSKAAGVIVNRAFQEAKNEFIANNLASVSINIGLKGDFIELKTSYS